MIPQQPPYRSAPWSVLVRLALGPTLLGIIALLVGAGLLASKSARAEGVLVLTDSRVVQYQEAVRTAKSVLPNAPVLEVGASDISQQLGKASAAVILAVGQKAMTLAQQAGATVVFCMVLGPSALTAKTVTGVRLEVESDVQLELFQQLHPAAKHLGIIYNPRTWSGFVKEAEQAAARRGVKLVPKPVSDAREVRSGVSDIAGSIDALWLMPDPGLITIDVFNFLLVFTLERKIALFGFFEGFTRAGALASVAPDYAAIGRQAAKLAADLAAKPAESRLPLPASVASPGVLTINAKTARQLGLDVPDAVQNKAIQVYR